jgi:2-hydroxy-3-keto-5-methylthiopentenyl-1-phosphate phosphatase
MKNIKIFCDFDGTITVGDLTDLLLERLAEPAWKEVEERWLAGKITSRECMGAQVSMIRGGWEAVRRTLEEVRLDPTFAGFAKWCGLKGFQLIVASDGLDLAIDYLLKREGIEVDAVWANRLVEKPHGRLALDFSAAPLFGRCEAGVCKCGILKGSGTSDLKVVVGDGKSDVCWAPHADVLFAKTGLLAYCQENQIACFPYRNFNDIQATLNRSVLREKVPGLGEGQGASAQP